MTNTRQGKKVHLITAQLIPFLFVSLFCDAQATIRGMVTGFHDEPVPDATVLLLQAKDSSLLKGSMTNKNGSYSFDNIPSGNYLVSSSYTGFKEVYSAVFAIPENQELQVATLRLSEKITSLTTVNVIAKKPCLNKRLTGW